MIKIEKSKNHENRDLDRRLYFLWNHQETPANGRRRLKGMFSTRIYLLWIFVRVHVFFENLTVFFDIFSLKTSQTTSHAQGKHHRQRHMHSHR